MYDHCLIDDVVGDEIPEVVSLSQVFREMFEPRNGHVNSTSGGKTKPLMPRHPTGDSDNEIVELLPPRARRAPRRFGMDDVKAPVVERPPKRPRSTSSVQTVEDALAFLQTLPPFADDQVPLLSDVPSLPQNIARFFDSVEGRGLVFALPLIGARPDKIVRNPMTIRPHSICSMRCSSVPVRPDVSPNLSYNATLRARATKIRALLKLKQSECSAEWAQLAWLAYLRSPQWFVNAALEKHIMPKHASVDDPLLHVVLRNVIEAIGADYSFQQLDNVPFEALNRIARDPSVWSSIGPIIGMGYYPYPIDEEPPLEFTITMLTSLLWVWCGTEVSVDVEHRKIGLNNYWLKSEVWKRL